MGQTMNAEMERVRIHLSARAAAGPAGRAAGKASTAAPSTGANAWQEELAKATCEVFEVMVGTALETPTAPDTDFVPDFAAMVGIAGSLCGLVSIHTSSECARRISAKMLGSDDLSASEDAQDALGEVCNMIAGSFKARIAGLADGCALSVPTVIFGRDFTLFSLARGEHYEATYLFEGKLFTVSLDLHG